MKKYIYMMVASSALLGIMEYRYVLLDNQMFKKDRENDEAMLSISKHISKMQRVIDRKTSMYEACQNSIKKMTAEVSVENILKEKIKYEKIFDENNDSSVTGSYSY